MFLSMVLPVVAFYIVACIFSRLCFLIIVCCDGLSAFAGLIVYFGFRNNKLFIHNDFIIKQSGSWDIDNAIIEPLKFKQLQPHSCFWHKKADIGSIIHTAGGDLEVFN
jgi:putative membrane protein